MSRSHSRERSREREETTSLLVRNLGYDCGSSELRKVFEKYGEIRDVYIPTDYHSGKRRGFAFVEFKEHDDARDALSSLNHTDLYGRKMEIVFAKDRRKSPREMKDIDRDSRRDRDSSRGRRRRDSSRGRRRSSSRDRDERSDRRRRRSPSPRGDDRKRSHSRSHSRSPSSGRGGGDRTRSASGSRN